MLSLSNLSDKTLVSCSLYSYIHLPHMTETATKTGMVIIFGEITSNSVCDYQNIVRRTVKEIGYDDSNKGLTLEVCVF